MLKISTKVHSGILQNRCYGWRLTIMPWTGFVKSTTINMAKTMRAKFNVAEIAKYGNGGGTKVTLMPVMGNSEENKAFWQYTPSGKIEMHISNPEAEFEFGEYYIDFTKAE
jgi:hypothetical protein